MRSIIKNYLRLLITAILLINVICQADNMNVTATIQPACTNLDNQLINFPNYNWQNSPQILATINITCTNGTSYFITATQGNNSDGTFRAMSDGQGHLLKYNLYVSENSSIIWGGIGGFGSPILGFASGDAEQIVFTGKIPSGQTNAPAGIYTDQIIVTVNIGTPS